MNHASIIALDLDRTLIYSAKALMLEQCDEHAPEMVVAEVYKGKPISFMTRAARSTLRELSAECLFVPVTTRTIAQYRRVRLSDTRPRFAVTSNGGNILVDGVPDEDWNDKVRAKAAAETAPLAEIERHLGLQQYHDAFVSIKDAEGLFKYVMVDRSRLCSSVMTGLESWCGSRGWTVSLQGRKLYCTPSVLTKEAAVHEVMRRTEATQLIAAGDSLLDRQMLFDANIAFSPLHGELADTEFRFPGLQVTQSKGVLAGEEILRLIEGHVSRFVRPGSSTRWP